MKEELELMLRVLYHIVPPNDFSGNTRNALELLDFNDDETGKSLIVSMFCFRRSFIQHSGSSRP